VGFRSADAGMEGLREDSGAASLNYRGCILEHIFDGTHGTFSL